MLLMSLRLPLAVLCPRLLPRSSPSCNVCRTFSVSDNVAPILTHSSGDAGSQQRSPPCTAITFRSACMPPRHYFAQPTPIPIPSPFPSFLRRQQRLAANALWFLPSALAHSLFVNVRVGVSPSALPSPPPSSPLLLLRLLLLLFAFCQNGNEENLHGRCICGIFPSGHEQTARRTRTFRCSHVLFNHFCLCVFRFCIVFGAFVHALSFPLSLPLCLSVSPSPRLPAGCHLSCIFMRISKSPVQVLRESCAHLLRATI